MKNTATGSVEATMKSTSLTYAAIAALAPSTSTVERVTMVADDADRDDALRQWMHAESITLRASESPNPVDNDYPRNRAERRAAATRARRGAPAKRR